MPAAWCSGHFISSGLCALSALTAPTLAESNCHLLQGCWLFLSEFSCILSCFSGHRNSGSRWSSVDSFWSRWGGGKRTGAQNDQFLLQAMSCWTGVKDSTSPLLGTGPISCCLSKLKGRNSVGILGSWALRVVVLPCPSKDLRRVNIKKWVLSTGQDSSLTLVLRKSV